MPLFDTIFRNTKGPAEHARTAYYAAVADARSEQFYREFGVPDSVDGRFEMIVLHVILLIRRLREDGAAGDAFAQALIETLIDDMDRSLREMGVGDLSVGKKVKQMAASFYGHTAAYNAALAADSDEHELSAALRRNVFGTTDVDNVSLDHLCRYVRACVSHLQELPIEAILAGKPTFAAIAAQAERD